MDQLHVYGQQQWHDETVIVGTPGGLFVLRDVLSKAVTLFMDDLAEKMKKGHRSLPPIGTATNKTIDEPMSVFISDGEGYSISVVCIDKDNEHWDALALPYHDRSMFQIKPNEEYWNSALGKFLCHGLIDQSTPRHDPERGVYISRKDAQAITDLFAHFFAHDNAHPLVVKAQQAVQSIRKSLSLVSDEDVKYLMRFHETTEDGEGTMCPSQSDVPKSVMKRLASIGLIGHSSAGRYFITEFGQSVIDAEE